MSSNELNRLTLPRVAKLHAYTPGFQPGESGWTKLNTNESPYPPSPRVAEAIMEEIKGEGELLRLYPSPTSAALRECVASLHNIKPENVIVGNGSDDILNLIVRAFSGEGMAAVGMTVPSYSLYPVLTGIQGGELIQVPFDRSMKLPIDAIAGSGEGVFFLTSPNAPTGVAFDNEEIEALLNRYKGLLVVDEAYADFAVQNSVELLACHKRLIITRTLSKAQALAGIRLGYAMADEEIIGLLDRVRDSYNVNRLSQAAGLAALRDSAYYARSIGMIKATRDSFKQFLDNEMNWFTYPSQSNFLFTEPRNARGESSPEIAKSLYDYFISQKILVRYFGSHALTASFLRISVGTDDEISLVKNAIKAWIKNA